MTLHRPRRGSGRHARHALAMAAVSAGLAAWPARAHSPADPDGSTFQEAVARAWARLPQRREFAARQTTAAARYQAGGALFPNAPVATGTHVNDRVAGSNYDYVTTQIELSTPVWLPGEGTATQRSAAAQRDAAAAGVEAAHLALAARVLELSARAALAGNAREVAERRLAASRALAADAARRFRVGEGAEADSLAADAEAQSVQAELSDAQAQLAAARAALAAVTGQEAVPRLAAPPGAAGGAPAQEVLSRHPEIAAAERAVQAAQASAALVRIEDRDSPEIGVQGINEKQPGARWDTRFGVVVRIPFATEARNAPRRAAAEEEVTQAEVRLEETRREVGAGVRQAEAALLGAEQAEAASRRAAAEQTRRRGMIERAWRAGEQPLIEVVRADALAFDAELAQAKGRTALDAARLRLVLAEGLFPWESNPSESTRSEPTRRGGPP